jgi:hypothetical protein
MMCTLAGGQYLEHVAYEFFTHAFWLYEEEIAVSDPTHIFHMSAVYGFMGLIW